MLEHRTAGARQDWVSFKVRLRIGGKGESGNFERGGAGLLVFRRGCGLSKPPHVEVLRFNRRLRKKTPTLQKGRCTVMAGGVSEGSRGGGGTLWQRRWSPGAEGERNSGAWVRGVVLTGPWVYLGLGGRWQPQPRPLGVRGGVLR